MSWSHTSSTSSKHKHSKRLYFSSGFNWSESGKRLNSDSRSHDFYCLIDLNLYCNYLLSYQIIPLFRGQSRNFRRFNESQRGCHILKREFEAFQKVFFLIELKAPNTATTSVSWIVGLIFSRSLKRQIEWMNSETFQDGLKENNYL